ncbi:MAG: biotin--[acetyl-CoA-carboxylase] ligase [Parvibaculaceae bacterium]|nr:biotin--[acetyl-CoA-carboxylase] ligase [Parvibaculaceae bacterium]
MAGPGSNVWPQGYGQEHFEEIDSTNTEARRRGETSAAASIWLRADSQTAGRGRRGRTWVSPVGNLMCTLFLRPACSPSAAAELSFVSGLAIHDAVAQMLPQERQHDAKLKWPNDLLLGGKKMSGILLESATQGAGEVNWLAIGIGLNLAVFPEDTPYPATSLLAETGQTVSSQEALTRLANAFAHWHSVWQAPGGFEAVRTAWLARAKGVGERIVVRLSDTELEGTFEALDGEGALILRLDDGSHRAISAGDVFFGKPK